MSYATDFIPKVVKKRANGSLEKVIWAATDKRLDKLIKDMVKGGWRLSGEPFRRDRQIVAVMIHPGNRTSTVTRPGWQ